ncbi:hypothetical protein BG015_007612 [Linnemannia schmuckeri]|uniref:Rpr2-domain-containing protein n=1 Tax=Linnemannia schmuckeri TaxID=64567 RepID=A0A9P5S1T1_9FUNG|nr:hypothetical protein BG015_007612 [Linnemannia schmuckeri]
MSEANSRAARLQFLWKASHLLLAQCPGASSHYMSQFLSLANDHDLRLHKDIQTRSCAACGTIFVPGVNSKVRVVPVPETRAEREKRKRVERKKAKQDKKQQKAQETEGEAADLAATASSSSSDHCTTTTTSQLAGSGPDITKTTTNTKSPQVPPRSKKIIRITPHTELAQQQQQQQNQQRINIRNGSSAAANTTQKPGKHANQILNHIIYSCQRCDRVTELPGTKEGFLNTRVKVTKPVSQRRKLKALQKQQQQLQEPAAVGAISASSTNPSTPKAATSGSQPLNTITSARFSPKLPSTPTNNKNTNVKRLASSYSSPSPAAVGHQDSKRTKYSVSLPASPTTGLSRATSAASSAATSPAVSPRPFGSDDKKPGLGGGGGNNKKKKKGGLMSMLASQKSKDSDAGSGGSAGGSGSGDSVLANFLMGL